jgi:hypothetical protein
MESQAIQVAPDLVSTSGRYLFQEIWGDGSQSALPWQVLTLTIPVNVHDDLDLVPDTAGIEEPQITLR